MITKISRRSVLRAALVGVGGALAACAPKVQEKIVEVEKVVKETVVVEKEVAKEVEKIVKETVVVAVDGGAEKADAFKGKLVWETSRGPGTGWNEERIKTFREMYPNVDIELLPMPYNEYAPYYTKFAAGQLSDLVCFDPGHFVFKPAINNGMILSMDDFIDADPELDLSAWFDAFITIQRHEGSIWGFPSWGWTGADCLIANKVMLEENSIPVPDPYRHVTPMDDIAAWLRQLHRTGSKPDEVECWGGMNARSFRDTGIWVRAFNAEIFDEEASKSLILDDENCVAAFKLLYDLNVVDQVMAATDDLGGRNQNVVFVERRLATMQSAGLNMGRYIRALQKGKEDQCEATAIYFPMREDGVAPTSVAGGSWNIGSQTKYPDIAYEFNKHISSYDGTLGLNLYGGEGALTRPDVYEILKVREVGYAWGEESLVKGAPPPEAKNNRGKELDTVFTQYCTILLDRRQPVPFEKGLEDLHKAVQSVLDKPTI